MHTFDSTKGTGNNWTKGGKGARGQGEGGKRKRAKFVAHFHFVKRQAITGRSLCNIFFNSNPNPNVNPNRGGRGQFRKTVQNKTFLIYSEGSPRRKKGEERKRDGYYPLLPPLSDVSKCN